MESLLRKVNELEHMLLSEQQKIQHQQSQTKAKSKNLLRQILGKNSSASLRPLPVVFGNWWWNSSRVRICAISLDKMARVHL
jgi:hypothetical protein